jgi:hypothetical protein
LASKVLQFQQSIFCLWLLLGIKVVSISKIFLYGRLYVFFVSASIFSLSISQTIFVYLVNCIACLSICFSIFLSFCLSLFVLMCFFYLFVLSDRISSYLFLHWSIYFFVFYSFWLTLFLSISLSSNISFFLSLFLSISLFVQFFTDFNCRFREFMMCHHIFDQKLKN